MPKLPNSMEGARNLLRAQEPSETEASRLARRIHEFYLEWGIREKVDRAKLPSWDKLEEYQRERYLDIARELLKEYRRC